MRVAITGGTGFVGSYLVAQLLSAGHELRVVARGSAHADLPTGLLPTFGDVVSGRGLEEAFEGAEVVVNLAAVIRNRGVQTFESVNAGGSARVARAALAAGARRVVQLSAIGADPDPRFPYLYSKWQGEQAVRGSGLETVILRSSVVFGKGDGFFTLLARAIAIPSPFLVVPGNGAATFQPIHAEDLARCLVAAVEDGGRAGQLYELGGPEQLTLDQITEVVARVTGREWLGITRRRLLHLDPRLIRPGAVLMDKLLPNPLVTPDQLDMLVKPNVAQVDAVRSNFGFDPRPLEPNLGYLRRQRRWPMRLLDQGGARLENHGPSAPGPGRESGGDG